MIRIQIDDLNLKKHGALFTTPRLLNPIHDRIAPHPDGKAQHPGGPTGRKLFSDRVRAAGRRKWRFLRMAMGSHQGLRGTPPAVAPAPLA